MHITALLIQTEIWGPPRCSSNRQMKKLGCPYAADFLKHTEERGGAICRKIDAGIKEREISRSMKTNVVCFLSCVESQGRTKGTKANGG